MDQEHPAAQDDSLQGKGIEGNPDAERSLLADLLEDSRLYHTSKDYADLLDFVSRLRNFAPFNAMLLHVQKPGLTFAASAWDWKTRFNRTIKEDARPLVILWPFCPVALVYDVLDESQIARFESENELDFSLFLKGVQRFRGNAFVQRGCVGAVFRLIPNRIPKLSELGLPPVLGHGPASGSCGPEDSMEGPRGRHHRVAPGSQLTHEQN